MSLSVQKGVEEKTIRFFDMFSGVGGFREGLTRAGGFVCVGHCEIDKYAEKSYRALFDTEGEWYSDDARKMQPEDMPGFDLLWGANVLNRYAQNRAGALILQTKAGMITGSGS